MEDHVFVDTNVFLRFFAKDVEPQYERARKLFERAEAGKIRLETSELVIAKIVWVLESIYGFTRKEIADVLIALLSTRNLKIANSARISASVQFYVSGNMDFNDAYNIAYMKSKELAKIATFDLKHYKKVDGISTAL